MSVRTNLSVADNATRAVLLHFLLQVKDKMGEEEDKTTEEKNKTTNLKII